MIRIVKGKDNTIGFEVQIQDSIGELSATFSIGGITKDIPSVKTGKSFVLTSAEVGTLDLGKCFAVIDVKNADESYTQTIREPFEVVVPGTSTEGMTTIHSVFFLAKEGGGCHKMQELPWQLKSGDYKYNVNIVDDEDGIDWTIERVVE